MDSPKNERRRFAFWKLAKIIHGLSLKDTFVQMPTADVLLIAPDAARNEKTERGLLFCRLFDPLATELQNLGMNVTHLNRSPSVLSPGKTHCAALSYNRSHVTALILSLFLPRSRGFRLRTRWAQRLIQESGAGIIFTWEGQAEVRVAANEMGIPCIEVLHGIGYRADGSVGWITGSEGVWPTHLICFDLVTFETVTNLVPTNGTKVFLAKNYWLSHFLEAPSFEPEMDRALELLFPTFSVPTNYKHRILITLGWGHDAFSSESPLNRIWELVNERNDQRFWMIRFHPFQVSSNRKVDQKTIRRARARFGGLENVDIEHCQQIPIPLIAKQSTHHITIESMSAYEVAEFGVPTLLLGTEDNLAFGANEENYFEDLISEGFATQFQRDERSVWTWIETQVKLDPRGRSQEGETLGSIMKKIEVRTSEGASPATFSKQIE